VLQIVPCFLTHGFANLRWRIELWFALLDASWWKLGFDEHNQFHFHLFLSLVGGCVVGFVVGGGMIHTKAHDTRSKGINDYELLKP
jgi:hypothetical protein